MIGFSVETGLRALVGVFLLSCAFLATSYKTTFAFDHPLTSAILACFFSGASLLVLSRFIHHIPTISSSPNKYSAIPLTQSSVDDVPLIALESDIPTTRLHIPGWGIRVGLFSAIGCIRIALYRSITINIECAPVGYSYSIPLLVALYDYWRSQRSRHVQKGAVSNRSLNPALRLPAAIASRLHFLFFQSPSRYIVSATFLAMSGYLTSSFHDGRQSTYICPIISGQHLRQHLFKILSVVLDFLILVGAAELSGAGSRPREGRGKQALVSWGSGLLGVAVFWVILALYLTTSASDNGFVTSHYLRSAISQAALVTSVILSASQLIPYYGMVGLSVLASFISTYFTWTSTIFNGQEPFPLIFSSHAFSALFSGFIGIITFLHARIVSEDEPQFLQKFNWFARLIFTFMVGIGLVWTFNQPSMENLHPIDLLIYDGQKNHEMWQANAKGGETLASAIRQYQLRYNQHPPPGFGKWYEYAVNRSSVIIDDFDQIYTNLRPFRALTPHQIRDLTQQLATNPFNDIGAISIRSGKVRVQEGITPTHRWMVLGAAEIIEKFSEYLPDMDLAFNLNDEPRVVVPWEKMRGLKHQAHSHFMPPAGSIRNEWSANRDETWGPIEPADQTEQTMFTDSSFKNIFHHYVSPACGPGSKARSQRIWDRRNLCTDCLRPHSLGQFPTNWRVTTDICHQPDLASLHGFFLSPASFKVTQELMPVFSQSSISVFNDIMFPSPWNYVNKISYMPSDDHPDHEYSEKANRLFWIGSTTEALSHDGIWKGIPRQRLAHLMNNNTYNQLSVLLPTTNPDTYSYQVLDPQAPAKILGLDATVNVADPIVRCWGQDCDDQAAELGGASRVDFQSHWQHRYLFDSDGAGFSGRFLPFLQSRSVPFKTGLFRQWFDDRVSPWMHFVPIDLRLHGLWSTLAYFAGVDATVGNRHVKMEPHDLQGHWIAEEGRKWAETALRKEDMEIYFFRLLLEWGRLTDDRRDELGYKLE